MAAALLVTILGLAGHIAYYEDPSLMLKAVRLHMQPDDTVVEYQTFQPTAIYYTARAVPIVGYANNSGLDESHPNFKKLYINDRQLGPLLKSSPRWFMLTKREHGDTLTKFGKAYLIARTNGYMMVSNQPQPGGLIYDYVSPAKRIVKTANGIQPT